MGRDCRRRNADVARRPRRRDVPARSAAAACLCRDEAGVDIWCASMARGQVIGEISLYTDEPRSATVVAIRDSVLRTARQGAVHPPACQRRAGVDRADAPDHPAAAHRAVALPARETRHDGPAAGSAPGVRCRSSRQRLAAACGPSAACASSMRQHRRATCSSRALGPRRRGDDVNRRIALHLDQIEASTTTCCGRRRRPTPWTERCSRRCDELLLLADAAQPPVLHDTEVQYLMRRPGRTEAAEILVLLHPADTKCPEGTRHWLARRAVTDHIHMRAALDGTWRAARIQSRTAVGLVLAGGGARGLAHLGVYRALRERGIEIDCVGGTSIGAVMAALVASDRPVEEVTAIVLPDDDRRAVQDGVGDPGLRRRPHRPGVRRRQWRRGLRRCRDAAGLPSGRHSCSPGQGDHLPDLDDC